MDSASNGIPGFAFQLQEDGHSQNAKGDWHGSMIALTAAAEGDLATAFETLLTLHTKWSDWHRRLNDAVTKQYGPANAIQLKAITAYEDGYFEMEFSEENLFTDAIALAVGTVDGGFEEIGIGG